MKRLFAAAAAFAVVLGTGGAAEAAKPKKNKAAGAEAAADAMFVKLDTNNDGKLTKSEFMKLPTVLPAAGGAAKKPGKGKAAKKAAAGGTDLNALWNKVVKADSTTLTKEDFRAVPPLVGTAKKKAK